MTNESEKRFFGRHLAGRPTIPMRRKDQYLVIRVQTDAGNDPFRWNWNELDYSPVTEGSPIVLVYGIFDGDRVPDRDDPQIHWHRPHGHDF